MPGLNTYRSLSRRIKLLEGEIKMDRRFAARATLVAALAATAGLFATPSHSASKAPGCDPLFGCPVYLTGAGPSPTTLTERALQHVRFHDGDSVPHTVVFANGLCSISVPPDQGDHFDGATCPDQFMSFVGSYAYTVDGKFAGTVVTTPLPRRVSLRARSNTIRGGTRLRLHGQVTQSNTGTAPPPPVVVLARHNSNQPFEPVATVRTRGSDQVTYAWSLAVQPKAATTYIAEVTAQRLCYFPHSRCAHPQGQVWTNAKSPPLTVRIRH